MGQATGVPATVEDLIGRYERYIEGCIRKIGRGRVAQQDMEDYKQEILLRVLEKDCIQKYDASKATFPTYLFTFVRTIVINRYERQRRDPLVQSVGSDALMMTFEPLVDRSFEARQIAYDLADRLEERLEEMQQGPRTAQLPRTFRLMRADHRTGEIAKEIGVTPSCVSDYIKRIKVEAVRLRRCGCTRGRA